MNVVIEKIHFEQFLQTANKKKPFSIGGEKAFLIISFQIVSFSNRGSRFAPFFVKESYNLTLTTSEATLTMYIPFVLTGILSSPMIVLPDASMLPLIP